MAETGNSCTCIRTSILYHRGDVRTSMLSANRNMKSQEKKNKQNPLLIKQCVHTNVLRTNQVSPACPDRYPPASSRQPFITAPPDFEVRLRLYGSTGLTARRRLFLAARSVGVKPLPPSFLFLCFVSHLIAAYTGASPPGQSTRNPQKRSRPTLRLRASDLHSPSTLLYRTVPPSFSEM